MTEYQKYYIVGGVLAGIGGLLLYIRILFAALFFTDYPMPPLFWSMIIIAPICLVTGIIILVTALIRSRPKSH
jgi:hypothetical protein